MYKKSLTLIVLSFLVLFSTQNCGNYNFSSNTNLASSHTASILDVDHPSYKTRVGDRIFVASVLADVFLPHGNRMGNIDESKIGESVAHHIKPYITNNFDESEDDSIVSVIEDKILKQINDFNGSCDFVSGDETCNTNRGDVDARQNELNINMISPITAVREGYRVSACNEITEKDRAISNVIFNVTGLNQAKFEERNVLDILNLFYPSQNLESSEVNAAIIDLVSAMKAGGESDFDMWRNATLAVCKTTGWQIP